MQYYQHQSEGFGKSGFHLQKALLSPVYTHTHTYTQHTHNTHNAQNFCNTRCKHKTIETINTTHELHVNTGFHMLQKLPAFSHVQKATSVLHKLLLGTCGIGRGVLGTGIMMYSTFDL